MNNYSKYLRLWYIHGIAVIILSSLASAQEAPEISSLDVLGNGEVRLEVTGTQGAYYRVDTSANLVDWAGWRTFRSNGADSHQDSTTPYLAFRFYRGLLLEGTNLVTGDHLNTVSEDVIIHPLYHASLVIRWGATTIYVDPDDDPAYASRYQNLQQADLVLITHTHGDHLSVNQINLVRKNPVIIIAPQAVYDQSSFSSLRSMTTVLNNGNTANLLGIAVEAVPAYNSPYHPQGQGNGYVLTLANRRIYISGDTGNTPELRALSDIDMVFLCMNEPYTMTVPDAVSATRTFRPKIVYPYHYRNSNGSFSDLDTFKQQIGTALGIEVRLRDWY